MSHLYTKNGRPLLRRGDDLFTRSGKHAGRIKSNGKVYDPAGQYVGTVVGDRVVYRSTDSATIGSPFVPRLSSGTAAADRVGVAILGEEPSFSD